MRIGEEQDPISVPAPPPAVPVQEPAPEPVREPEPVKVGGDDG